MTREKTPMTEEYSSLHGEGEDTLSDSSKTEERGGATLTPPPKEAREKESKKKRRTLESEKETVDEGKGAIWALEQKLASCRKETEVLKENALRRQADLENFRKRTTKEKRDAIKYGNQDLLTDLLEVIDNFERAIKSSGESQDFALFREGVAATERHFTNILGSRWGLEKIEARGVPYDPVLHEALLMEESDQYEQELVIEEFQVGYRLYERVLRPAKVKVGKPLAKSGNSSPLPQGSEDGNKGNLEAASSQD